MKEVIKEIILIALSITIGLGLLHVCNSKFKILQILGYCIIMYPVFLFFRLFIGILVISMKTRRLNKKYKVFSGNISGIFKINNVPSSGIKCIIKNADGTDHDRTPNWITFTHENGSFKIDNLPNGQYMFEFFKQFNNGPGFFMIQHFEIKNQQKVKLNINK
jgi:hypothetical protein